MVGNIVTRAGSKQMIYFHFFHSFSSANRGIMQFLEHSRAALPDFPTSTFRNVDNSLAGRDILVINPIIELLSSRATQNIPNMLGYL